MKYYEVNDKKPLNSIKTTEKLIDKSQTQVIIDNLEPNKKYGFQIRVKSTNNVWGEYSQVFYASTMSTSSSLSNNVINNLEQDKEDEVYTEDDSTEMRFFASVSVAVVVFLVLTIIAIVFVLRTKHQDDFIVEKKSTMEKNPLDYASNDGRFSKILISFKLIKFRILFCSL